MVEPRDAGLDRLWSWHITSISTPLTTTAAACTKRAQPHAFCFCRCHGDQATRWFHPPAFHCRAHTSAHKRTQCVATQWLFSQGVKRSLSRPWTGVEPISPITLHPITAASSEDTHHLHRLVVSPAAQKGAHDGGESVFRWCSGCAAKTAIFWWFHFLRRNKMIRCWRCFE